MINERPATLLACTAIAATFFFIGCSKNRDMAPEASMLPGETAARIDQAVTAYDLVRGALAEDRADVKTPAAELADATRLAAASAPENLRLSLAALSSAAQRLAGLKTRDVDELREAFGEVSRALIAVLSAEPGLQRGRHVYECPMAKGYKKWVQVSEGVSNPYMGSDMLQCGSKAGF